MVLVSLFNFVLDGVGGVFLFSFNFSCISPLAPSVYFLYAVRTSSGCPFILFNIYLLFLPIREKK